MIGLRDIPDVPGPRYRNIHAGPAPQAIVDDTWPAGRSDLLTKRLGSRIAGAVGAADAFRIAALKKQIWPDCSPFIGREQPRH